MNRVLHGFADELVKVAFAGAALKGVGKLIVKHPVMAATALMTAGGTAAAASSAYKQGLKSGERPRYLAASADGPSEAAYNNYNQLFERPPTARQQYDLHRWYREGAYKR